MYGRLVLRNARRSIKDYLIYMVTLTLCVMLFYAFLSISSRYYDPPIGSEYNIEMLSGGMKTAVCFITGLLIFLIQYVNRYMLLRKKKEFAVELVMGMERETLARLFLGETFLMGAVSLVCGIIMGIFLAQVISAMLLTMYGAKFQISWTLYPDTVLLTVFFFFSCLIVVGFFHRRAICRLKIIEMLQADKMNEDSHKKDGWMDVLTFLFFGFLLFMAYTGVGNMSQAYDSRLSPVVKCILLGNVICPVGNLALGLIWFFRRGRWPFRNLLKALMVMELPLVAAAAGVPFIHSSTKVLFAVSEDVLEKYMIFLIFHIIYSVFLMFYLLGGALENIRKKSILFTYREENLFLLGQLITKLKTATKSMSLICIAVVLSVNLFLATPVVIGWLFGYLDARAVYDIQMYSQYQKTHSIDEVSGVNYAAVDDFLETNQVDIQWKHSVDFYLTRREEFTNRTVADFPVLAISLSDYNELRAASQLEPIRLQADEFVTQWKSIATDDESEEFAAGHQSLHTDGGRLRIAETGIIEEDLGEYLYHKYTNVIYVVPDEICKSLLPVNYHSYMKTEEPVPYKVAEELEAMFESHFPQQDEGVQYFIRIRTLQQNGAYTSSFTIRASMIYLAVVLLIICFTILALQQLYDASGYRYRFGVLHKIGVDKTHINRLIFRQLIFWFGAPIGTAILFSVFLFQMLSAQIAAYIAIESLVRQILGIVLILSGLTIGYFVATWYLFRRTVFHP